MEKFIGTWSLVSWQAIIDKNEQIYPFGDSAQGHISYDANGRMSVQIMRPDRPAFKSGDIFAGTEEEISAAYKGFIAYSGTYKIEEKAGTVTHFLQISSFPNWVGTEQLRYFEFKGDRLQLSTDPITLETTGNMGASHQLIWQREN